MVTAKEGKDDWDEYRMEDDHDVSIKVMEHSTTSKLPSAMAQAEDDVAFYVENKGEDCGWYVGDDVTVGDYTWHTVHFPWNGENSSEKFLADVNDDYYIEVDCFMMDENNDEVIKFLESFHTADGDIGELHLAWKQALWAEEE